MDYTIYTKPIDDLMAEYEALHVELSPMLAQMDELRAEIVRRVRERGENVAHGNVTATYRNGYTRTNWDGKALDGYAVAHPEILTFRSETETKPSVSVKVVLAG